MALGYSAQVGVPYIEPLDFFSIREEVATLVLDVRELEEFNYTNLDNSLHIPLGELELNIDVLKSKHINDQIVVVCRSGMRSAMATEFMINCGFPNVRNLDGGILELAKHDNRLKPY